MSIVSVVDILGVPTPESLDDFCASSPDSSFSSSRHGSPCSCMSAETSPSSVASPPPSPEAPKIKTEPETKPIKKRKSWGQQLPTPTTNLPPRKRAKTAEEKEQRRVERVLRNRAAAQKSREVKKQQLEAIESERDMLKQKFESLMEANTKLTASNTQLFAQLKKVQEENARLKLHSNQPPQAVTEAHLESLFLECYGIDPNTTVSYPDSALDDSLSESSCMTHQPAELMCDLPCLQETGLRTSSLPAFTTLVTSLVFFIWSLASRRGILLSQPPPNPSQAQSRRQSPS
ncbi:hypothetical protein FN846DRAFT_423180 [Sphaerosporella brunnea]|uniref:BZIP domain-containing protein n=1 Tax=Sphaerosporella brunnea TaxID=1250544 RepID=A0A5J5EHY2_9PEZI|nr:hypothetical protein FN846DRAFT_423180 [Sphaerosporella brunnea]